MQQATRHLLETIAREVCILSDGLVALADEAPEMALSEVTLYPNERRSDPLVRALTERLYVRYYCRRTIGAQGTRADGDMIDALSAANAGADGWDPDWTLLGVDERGSALVRSTARTRLAEPGRYRAQAAATEPAPQSTGTSSSVGGRVQLLQPREDVQSQPDYYYALGETLGDRYEELVGCRLYLNIRARSAAHWIAAISRTLNHHRIPFAFKVLRHHWAYARVDSGVLYVPRRHAGFVSTIVKALAAQARNHERLRAPTPPFTRRLAPGLSLADSPPGGGSFGISRMERVAEAIVHAWRDGTSDVASRLRAIESHFCVAGLSLRRPWLNPGNVDVALTPPQRVAPPRHGPGWIDAADHIGAQVVRDAIWHGDECTWLGWSVVPGREADRPAVRTAGGDLYSGTAGIAVFLAQLAAVTNDPLQRATALGAFRHSLAHLRNAPSPVGAYSGLAGVLHAALVLADTLGDEQVAASIPGLIERIGAAQPGAMDLDIIEGRAGAIRVLLRAGQGIGRRESSRAIEVAVRFGQEILALANIAGESGSDDNGRWPQATGLLGYAHGSAGIARALFELHSASSDAGFLRTARAALGHEMSCFDPQARNWPDRRSLALPASAGTAAARSSLPSFMTAWCSGAPGVSLALSSCAAADAGAQVQQQFDAALQTTLASVAPEAGERLQPQSFCLCHGTAGNADILLQLAQRTGRDELRKAALAAAETGLRKHHATGNWPCGIRDGGQSPGLMLGLSGIGHFYLRVHDQTIATVL